ncbi:PREDICTED: prestalk protein-like [Amphimedon queenslandica]|uniref:Granulins domain-containing protein n=1 Tax=Amphimedon queenslandica TaxID=400682 RepID=A0A1X7VUW3_AMPQE|nr:PREDICTED: prestalk protein-like [Amphimedon queenslandica]|eukprot:XP_003382695.1 PREDICTED: prestalk protein-like [Amphimedon queenslandica]
MAVKFVLLLLFASVYCRPSLPQSNLYPQLDVVHCPNSEDLCPANNTCCRLTPELWGCCPHIDAYCCSDKRHCCPRGHPCSADSLNCSDSTTTFPSVLMSFKRQRNRNKPFFESKISDTLSQVAVNVNCTPPGSKESWQCPADHTCCYISTTRRYGCCPIVPATCCPDGRGCCPSGYTCDLTDNTCTPPKDSLATLAPTLIDVRPRPTNVTDIICPNGINQCPDGETCCRVSSDDFGCCHFSNAVCCADMKHCCPSGYMCSPNDGNCIRSQVAILKKKPAISISFTNVTEVHCPDGKVCLDGNTCCQTLSGSYGCCPREDAVCCADRVHCCPHGTECKSDGTCTRTNEVKKTLKLDSVKCPDGGVCLDGETCCRESGYKYGCCSYPDATCCSDGIHCCPSGEICDVARGTCFYGGSAKAMMKKLSFLRSPIKVKNVVCPDGGSCPDDNTCCLTGDNKYGCCPQPNANCCADKVHCCPSGYSCNVADGTCTRGVSVVPMMKKLSSLRSPSDVKNVVCPGGRQKCPDDNTCCELESGSYGCCPRPDAVCCADKTHCCPNGYTCQNDGTCKKDTKVYEALAVVKLDSVKCPDGGVCLDGQTCCRESGYKYGCCPYLDATCCSDGIHCCPSGEICDVARGTCFYGDSAKAMIKKLSFLKSPTKVKNVVCPNGRQECPDDNTCCELKSGSYGCCPRADAVCCADKIHCCPNGYTCENDGTCKRDSKVYEALAVLKLNTVDCPDGGSCPDNNTCCLTGVDKYGCCPQPNAVCCADKVHCCPKDFSCNTADHTCTKGVSVIPMMKKLPTLGSPTKLKGVVCPNGKNECPDGSTCCSKGDAGYGCCPLANAVCCADQTHCCPNGFSCDASNGTCVKEAPVFSALHKVFQPLYNSKVKENVCPDGQSECSDINTCCKTDTGKYGCCELPQATCCSDMKHCCPSGYICNSDGSCNRQDSFIQIEAVLIKNKVKDVTCSDGNTSCKNDQTCCLLKDGRYGCCNLTDANCCGDGIHCCPNGYSCDVAKGTCVKEASVIPILKKMMSVSTQVKDDIKCPDDTVCSDNNTCCKAKSNSFGCCPSPKATCCADEIHCCPSGTTCDLEGHTCRVSEAKHQPLLHVGSMKKPVVVNVVCPSVPGHEEKECSSNSTCCLMSEGNYGCCPFPNAVCCDDKKHCCPFDYACNPDDGTCTDKSKGFLYTIPPTRMSYKRPLL